jgi:hypothetical protein
VFQESSVERDDIKEPFSEVKFLLLFPGHAASPQKIDMLGEISAI